MPTVLAVGGSQRNFEPTKAKDFLRENLLKSIPIIL